MFFNDQGAETLDDGSKKYIFLWQGRKLMWTEVQLYICLKQQ